MPTIRTAPPRRTTTRRTRSSANNAGQLDRAVSAVIAPAPVATTPPPPARANTMSELDAALAVNPLVQFARASIAGDPTRFQDYEEASPVVPWSRPTPRIWGSQGSQVEHRGQVFRFSAEDIRREREDQTPVHRGRNIRVTVDESEFENRLAMAIIPLMAKKIRELKNGEPLPILIKMNGGEVSDSFVEITV